MNHRNRENDPDPSLDDLLDQGKHADADSLLENELADIHAALAERDLQAMPPEVRARLAVQVDRAFDAATPPMQARGSFQWWRSAGIAWAMAAASFVAMFLLLLTRDNRPESPESTEDEQVESSGQGWIRVALNPGRDAYSQADGWIEWNTRTQQGVLVITGLPENDPARSQYQLWVVDPLRDPDYPVDAGVFDFAIPQSGAAVVRIPFKPRLPVVLPRAFAVTLERPGGVVKSRNTAPVLFGTT